MEQQRYRKLSTFLRSSFGERVHKIGVCGGFTCPNRDGSLDTRGCLFCDPQSSLPASYEPGMSITEQLTIGAEIIERRFGARLFLAYLQDGTATHAPVGRLREIYLEALGFPGVVGLCVGTRPDCLGPEILELLSSVAGKSLLWVEIGVQSASDETLSWMRRGHDVEAVRRAFDELRGLKITTAAHVIIGAPLENRQSVLRTADLVRETGADAVKIHSLHVIPGTSLADLYSSKGFDLLEMEDYVDLAVDFLERTHPDVVVERLTGEARERTMAPGWTCRKQEVLRAVEQRLEQRDSWQGKLLGYPRERLWSHPLRSSLRERFRLDR